MASLTPEAMEQRKHAPAVPGILEIVLQRWSPRAFAHKEIPGGELQKLFEAARWAASSSNEQPWRFLVGRREDETYRKIFDCLLGFNRSWAGNAPVLILSAAKKIFSSQPRPNRFALHDLGAATANLSLQATALGMHTHSMAGFDAEKARAFFAIPTDYEIGAVTAVGYMGDPGELAEALRTREEAPRQRKPIEEFVFSAWETPADLDSSQPGVAGKKEETR